jgi:ribosomal protein L21E
MKRQHDKHVKPSRQYQPGDRVYLDASKIKTTRASKKLNAKFHGPFKIIYAVRKSAYKLELPTGWGIHDVFHESKLKPAHELQFPKQKETRPQPPPEIIDGNEEHEVEEVQGVRNKQGKKQFLVKWKGLPQEESSWEPEENLKNARGAIRDFFKRAITELDDNIPLPSPSLSPCLKDASPPIVPTPNGFFYPQQTPAHLLPLYKPHPQLYGWSDKEFHKEYLYKLEKAWQRWKSACKEAYSKED